MKSTSSVHNISDPDPPFGSRFLTEDKDVWSHNAWDHVPPPDDQAETITASLTKQRSAPVPFQDQIKYNEKPAKYWDNFYKANSGNFFRDRKWLHQEFPELIDAAKSDAGPMKIAEIGCGAGNSVFPLLSSNENPDLSLYAYDYSSHAVKVVQHHPLYLDPPLGTIHASVWDLTSKDTLPDGLEEGTVDIVILVFVLSALHPDEWARAIANVYKILKPNGLVLFRDYGRYDLTQLRFKGGRMLQDNFYIRGDKTRVYFFELDELSLLFANTRIDSEKDAGILTTTTRIVDEDEAEAGSGSGTPELASPPAKPPQSELTPTSTLEEPEPTTQPQIIIHPNLLPSSPSPLSPFQQTLQRILRSSPSQLDLDSEPRSSFTTLQLGIDRRLIVNRKRQLKMYRVWMQGKWKKN